MNLRPWRREHPSDVRAVMAINDARSRARKTDELLEEEADIASKLREQRMTNGFAEMIAAVISQSEKGK